MTKEEAIKELKVAMFRCKYDPITGDNDQYMDEDTRKQYEALLEYRR